MPKIKTHSGAKKRFSVTKNGKFKRGHVGKRHLLNGHGKTTKLTAPPPQGRLRRFYQRSTAEASAAVQVS